MHEIFLASYADAATGHDATPMQYSSLMSRSLGPVIIGAGRYRGYGFCRPIDWHCLKAGGKQNLSRLTVLSSRDCDLSRHHEERSHS